MYVLRIDMYFAIFILYVLPCWKVYRVHITWRIGRSRQCRIGGRIAAESRAFFLPAGNPPTRGCMRPSKKGAPTEQSSTSACSLLSSGGEGKGGAELSELPRGTASRTDEIGRPNRERRSQSAQSETIFFCASLKQTTKFFIHI